MATRPSPVLKFWNGSSFTDFGGTLGLLTIDVGKRTMRDRMGSARCDGVFTVTTGALDPSAGVNDFGPNTFMVVECEKSGGTDVVMFSGRVDKWRVTYPGLDHARIEVSASGSSKQITRKTITINVTDDVEDVLDTAVALAFDAAADGTYVIYTDPWGAKTGDSAAINIESDPISIGHALASGFGGDLAERFTDDVTHPQWQYIARRRRYQSPVLIFSDDASEIDPSAGIFPYDESKYASAATDDLIRNSVTVTRQGGTPQTFEDAASMDVETGHGPREHAVSSYHTTDALALVEAQRVVWEQSEPPLVAVEPIILEPDVVSDADLWDLVIDVGIEYTATDRFPLMRQATVKRTTPFAAVERNCILVGYRHEIRPVALGGWKTTLRWADGHRLTGGDVSTFTATLKQNGSTVASTANDRSYSVTNGWCTAHFMITASASGTDNSEIKITTSGLPAPATHAGGGTGMFWFISGAEGWHVGGIDFDGTDIRLPISDNAAAYPYLGQSGGITPALQLASGDLLRGTFTYRVA